MSQTASVRFFNQQNTLHLYIIKQAQVVRNIKPDRPREV